jgi:bifunctional non-homologous end joining protein LigD
MTLPAVSPVVVSKHQGQIFKRGEWFFEPKYDGWRAIYEFDQEGPRFISRGGKLIARFQDQALRISKELTVDSVILDGELTALDPATGYARLTDLVRSRKPIYYMAFDLMYLNGEDLRFKPLRQRKILLSRLLAKTRSVMAVSYTSRLTSGFLQGLENLGLEGVVIKKLDESYTTSAQWYKVINPKYKPSTI